ncbi:amino acid adenylation domain-containing protein [Paenibacillus sp. SC116]|uniref:amino acid adenylation domain-containing protein n=1 Tax=Paenibacillus sp. SC116 TaxID=2968986 RepID=UPI00215B6403|nr:non-ribosomal peptide synthetase [Paenibacillus sp. SC116]MCR8844952.1 amino acid adenylation domain-containing protein [Paenibacillus sp. SC116]
MSMKISGDTHVGSYEEEGSYVFPASDTQKRLWYLDELIPNNPAYHLSFPMRVHGRLQVSAFVDSLNELVRRHESFRTRFLYNEGELVQVVAPIYTLEVSIAVEEGLSEQARIDRAFEVAREEARQPFHLSQGPLLRASIVKFSDEDYVLLLTIHHIIIDGWSVGVMLQELEEMYQAFCEGNPVQLPDLELQYGDYSVWQQEWLQSEAFTVQMNYWRNRLKGHHPVLELPQDHVSQAMHSGRGGSYEFPIPHVVSTELAAIGQVANATHFMVYLAAFQVFLYRYSGQDDFCIGTLNANRNQAGLEGVIGCFVNTLVHRAQIKRGHSFREIAAQVAAECLEMFSNAEMPFDKIVEEIGDKRNFRHSPLFQVLFEYLNEGSSEDELSLPNLSFRSINIPGETAKFDLSLYIRNQGGAFSGKLEYNADLFQLETIERMAGHFVRMLEGIVSEPDRPIEQVSLLTKSECQAFTMDDQEIRNDQERECIHKRFEQQAERTPDAIAVESDEGVYTYRELNEQANRLAHYLRQQGVHTESLVALCLDRSFEMIVTILGVLKAGAAYVPIDPAAPADRVQFILEDADAAFMLVWNVELPHLPSRSEIINLKQIFPQLADYPANNLSIDVEPSNLAYVIYTSGSTGKPKGVLIEHANVHRLFTKTEHWFAFGEQDVWTLFHSYAFDFSVWEIWGALFYGGRLIVVPYWVSRSPESFYQLLVERKVTVLNQTPSSFRQLIQVDKRMDAELSLRYVIFGGEALDFRVLRSWIERRGAKQPELINMYGITETTVHVTYRAIHEHDVLGESGSYIGSPIPDLNVYILDDQLQPVPLGVYGEMYVAGAGLSRGYLNRPELTSERFIANPYSKGLRQKLYKTGDVARRLASGELEYRGRADTQVKIRGFRIELGEIESVLLQHPQVAEAVVAVKSFHGDSQGLVGYVVLGSPGDELRTDDIRSFLAQQLPDYMVVAQVLAIDRIPLTINGKVDVRALPEPNVEREGLSHRYVEPATEEEVLLADIWSQVLQVESIGVTDHYFELGGDSIRSLQILYQAREAGLNFSMQDLFKYPTIRGLIHTLKPNVMEQKEESDWLLEDERAGLPDWIEDVYPMSQSQIGMLYHSKLQSDTRTYHNVHTFKIRAPYSESAWIYAVKALIDRHPILRTSFELVRFHTPMQLVYRNIDLPLSFHDISQYSSEEKEAQLEAFILSERNNHFDWAKAPLIRFSVHRLDDDRFQLGITEHHAILDGWSVATMQVELFNLYLHHSGLSQMLLQDSPVVTYKDFIHLEYAAIRSSESREFWKRQLDGITMNKLPNLPSWSKAHGSDMSSESIAIPAVLSKKLLELAHRLQVPIKSVLLAAHLRIICLLCNQVDITTGVVFNGRPEQRDSERVLGMFLNTLPFRLQLQSHSWSQLIYDVFELEQDMLAHRHYPLAQIQQDQSGLELFETFFNFTNFHVLRELEEVTHMELLDERSYAETSFAFGVEFGVDPVVSDVRLDLRWDRVRFSDEQIERIGGYFLTVLCKMTDDTDSGYMGLHLLSEAEQQFMHVWNETERAYPVHCLHEQLEAQVRSTPESIALHFEGVEWSYYDLNVKANQIANALREQNIGAEARIGILFERSLELVASLYGTLKAGGAYVPIDPEFPEERLEYLIMDSGIEILLVQRKWKSIVPPSNTVVLIVEDILNEAGNKEFVCDGYDPDKLAYVLYTSGSTGNPKGVMITHRSISNRIQWMQEEYRLTADDSVMQKTPYSFDVSVWEFFWPLLIGAKLVIARAGGHKEPQYLAGLIAEQQITTLHFVPSMLSLFMEQASPEKCQSLRRVFCSGESLPFQVQQQFLYRFDAKLYNLYGPTEATVDVTHWECHKESPWEVVPIGRPVANTQTYILDDHLQMVPIGTPGELYIGGVQVGRGYLNREELTRERFIQDPFRMGGNLYKTGDMARFLPDGNIEYLGRNDDQVKIFGVRIELGEIERVLAGQDDVREAVVVALKNPNGEPTLVAYVVADERDEKAIMQQAKIKLPLYMVPRLVFLDSVPVNHNGKADRKALIALGTGQTDKNERALIAPRNELEAALLEIWEQVLGHTSISTQDHFFQIGGHSIAAVRLMSRITKHFNLELPLSVLFEHATIQDLALLIRQEKDLPGTSSTLINFTPQSSGLPMFFVVHPIGGNSICYARLAEELGQTFHVYGLQSLGLDGNHKPQTKVEEMANSYIQAIRTIQPQGPYYLGGWSFGGVIAYEIVRQLQTAGEEIALLAMYDSFAPIDIHRSNDDDKEPLLYRFIEDIVGTIGNEISVHQRETIHSYEDMDQLLPLLQGWHCIPQDLDHHRMGRLYQVFVANVQAERAYIPQGVLQVPTLLITANEGEMLPGDDLTLGWQHLIQAPIWNSSILCSHYSMLMQPHVTVLANEMRLAFTEQFNSQRSFVDYQL